MVAAEVDRVMMTAVAKDPMMELVAVDELLTCLLHSVQEHDAMEVHGEQCFAGRERIH